MHARTVMMSCGLGLALAAVAMAGPVESGNGSPLSDGVIPQQPLISNYSLVQTAARTIRFVRFQGTLVHSAVHASGAAPRDQVITLSNNVAGFAPVSFAGTNLQTFPGGGQVAVDMFVRLPTPVTVGPSTWNYAAAAVHDNDPAKYEAEWQNLNVTLNDGAPVIVNDLGTLTPGAVSRGAAMGLHETVWFRFTLPLTLNSSLGHFLDIDTEGSSLVGATNDTEIALYNEDGTRVGYDDDDGSGTLSQLTYGGGSRPGVGGGLAYNGRDGSTLPAGTYYLGVRGFEVGAPNAVGWDFSNTNASLRSGDVRVTVRTNVGQVIGCPADFNHDGTLQVQDVFDYLNAWFGGCP